MLLEQAGHANNSSGSCRNWLEQAGHADNSSGSFRVWLEQAGHVDNSSGSYKVWDRLIMLTTVQVAVGFG